MTSEFFSIKSLHFLSKSHYTVYFMNISLYFHKLLKVNKGAAEAESHNELWRDWKDGLRLQTLLALRRVIPLSLSLPPSFHDRGSLSFTQLCLVCQSRALLGALACNESPLCVCMWVLFLVGAHTTSTPTRGTWNETGHRSFLSSLLIFSLISVACRSDLLVAMNHGQRLSYIRYGTLWTQPLQIVVYIQSLQLARVK